eukprot:s855_g2.t1
MSRRFCRQHAQVECVCAQSSKLFQKQFLWLRWPCGAQPTMGFSALQRLSSWECARRAPTGEGPSRSRSACSFTQQKPIHKDAGLSASATGASPWHGAVCSKDCPMLD